MLVTPGRKVKKSTIARLFMEIRLFLHFIGQSLGTRMALADAYFLFVFGGYGVIFRQ